MRKRIVAFLCMMMVFTMTTGVAMAKSVDGKGQQDNREYRVAYEGVASEFIARATSNKAYTIIKNTANYNRDLVCTVRSYRANIGWTSEQRNSDTLLPDQQIDIIMDRDKSVVGYYYHTGKCYYNEHGGALIDSYTYKAFQWYYTN